MSNITLPGAGLPVATEIESTGDHMQVVAAVIERTAMMFAAQFLQNLAPFAEAGVLVRTSAIGFNVNGAVSISANVAPTSFGFSAALGFNEQVDWYQNIRGHIA